MERAWERELDTDASVEGEVAGSESGERSIIGRGEVEGEITDRVGADMAGIWKTFLCVKFR